jgi:AraC-like DNA-binding protein
MPRKNIHQIQGTDFFSTTGMPMSVFRIFVGNDPRHTHDFCEMVLISKGTGEHKLYAPESEIPTTASLKHGELLFIPLQWSHCYRETNHIEVFNVLFEQQLIESWPRSGALPSFGSGAFDAPAQWSLHRADYEHLETLLLGIMRELTGRQRGFELAAQARLAEVLVWVDRLSLRHHEKGTPESQIAISRAVSFLERHFAEPIVLEDIARQAHLSPHYFSEVFKNATGLSPGRYLLRLRLEHARYLLLTTSRPITQVAYEAGFADPSYFARAFKTAFGTAPSRLRSTGR